MAGCMVTAGGARPVPLSGTRVCPPARLALMAISAVRLPVWVGSKVTFTVQLAFLAITTPVHVSVSVKSLAAVPVPILVKAMPVTCKVDVPVSLMVTVWAAEAVPTVKAENVSKAGVTVIVVCAVLAVSRGICQIPRP